MAKYRSRVDYLQIFGGNKEGFNLGLDNQIFIRKETTERTFNAPRVGTQGQSVSATTPSEDISAGPDTNFRIAVDGGAVVNVTMVLTGLTSAPLIAAALETTINTALAAANQDGRVWVEWLGGLYHIWSQYTGTESSVVVTDGATANVADTLKIGVVNGGTETAGTNDMDALLVSSGGPKSTQPIESSPQRSGRFHAAPVKSKEQADYDLETFVNMAGDPGDSIDPALRVLLESAFGTQVIAAGNSIKYTQGLPNFTFTMVRVSTIFGEYYTGGYARDFSISFPGDGPATMKHQGRLSAASVAGIGKVATGGASSTTTIPMEGDHAKRFTKDARVMGISTDGRTILWGHDGSVYVNADPTTSLVVNTAVTIPAAGLVVPWHPGAIQATVRTAMFTDLSGSFKIKKDGPTIDITNAEMSVANDHADRDNIFGAKGNLGFVAGNRVTMNLSVTFDLSNENFQDVVQTRQASGFSPVITLGDPGSGRALKITAEKWIPSVPALEVPESGTTPITLEGVLYEGTPGAKNPVTIEFV